MARMNCSPRSIRICSFSRSLSKATRGSWAYSISAIAPAIMKMISRMNPPCCCLRRAVAGRGFMLRVLAIENAQRLLVFGNGIFYFCRRSPDTHNFIPVLYDVVLADEVDLLVFAEKSAQLGAAPRGSSVAVVLERNWWWRRRWGRLSRLRGLCRRERVFFRSRWDDRLYRRRRG